MSVNVNTNTNTVTVQDASQTITIVDNGKSNTINIPQPLINVIEVATPGPAGPAGANGANGDSINTSSLVTTSSFNAFTSSVNVFTASYNTGSFSGSFIGNLTGTASWAQYVVNGGNIDTSAFVTTSSFNAFTGSYNTGSFSGSFTGSLKGTASTASYYQETDPVFIAKSASLATTGSNNFNGNQTITGSLNISEGMTGSLFGTASWATNFVYASNYVLNSATSSFIQNNQTSSFVTNSQTSSFVTNSQTSSFVTNSQTSSMSVASSSNAQTASFLPTGTYNITSSWALTSSQASTSSYAITASFSITSSYTSGSVTTTGDQLISGIKTFASSPILITPSASQILVLNAEKKIESIDFSLYPSFNIKTNLNNIITVTEEYEITNEDEIIVADTSNGSFTVTFPKTSPFLRGKKYTIKKIGLLPLLINTSSSEDKIDNGDAPISLLRNFISRDFFCDGENWYII